MNRSSLLLAGPFLVVFGSCASAPARSSPVNVVVSSNAPGTAAQLRSLSNDAIRRYASGAPPLTVTVSLADAYRLRSFSSGAIFDSGVERQIISMNLDRYPLSSERIVTTSRLGGGSGGMAIYDLGRYTIADAEGRVVESAPLQFARSHEPLFTDRDHQAFGPDASLLRDAADFLAGRVRRYQH
jgi:hypothetical protein